MRYALLWSSVASTSGSGRQDGRLMMHEGLLTLSLSLCSDHTCGLLFLLLIFLWFLPKNPAPLVAFLFGSVGGGYTGLPLSLNS